MWVAVLCNTEELAIYGRCKQDVHKSILLIFFSYIQATSKYIGTSELTSLSSIPAFKF